MIELGLSRVTALLRERPLRWKAIHIAGTNGKGSVAAYVSALLHRTGVRVGRFTSPHLIDRWDCITLDQRPVEKAAFVDAEASVKFRDEREQIHATEFEILTATAFELFNRHGMQVGVIECGLGGLRDATNVLAPNDVLVSVITKVGLDHQDLLGSSVEAITYEKAGIVKKNVPIVVDGSNAAIVREMVRRRAAELDAPLHESSHSIIAGYQTRETSKLAHHQKDNLSLAVLAFEVAKARLKGPTATPINIAQQPVHSFDLDSVVSEVQREWRGRLQWLSIEQVTGRKDKVLLDGAHNTQSAEVLRDFVETHLRSGNEPRSLTWVLAMKSGKDVQGVLPIILNQKDNVVTCEFGPVDGMPWVKSCPAPELADAAAPFTDGKIVPGQSLKHAIQTAAGIAGEKGPLVIAGSLYLVSDVLRLLERGHT